jgi:hypothetical protein
VSSVVGVVLLVFRYFHDSFRESYIKPYKGVVNAEYPVLLLTEVKIM